MNDGADAHVRRHQFRPDIQGLRAVAVLVVVFNHASVGGLSGGFLGVDVFFVISGFLITQILLRQGRSRFRVSLGEFYARRARRILPAATLVLVATLAASLAWFSFLDAMRVARDAIWSALFVANVHFGAQGADYFNADFAASPLQHYWSLAVEEQFYLVWPAVIGAAFWLGRRRRARPEFSLRVVLALILAISAASLAWSIYATGMSPDTAYFSTFTRVWELGAGAAAAVWLALRTRPFSPQLREIGVGLGLLAILAAVLVYSKDMPLPGYLALLPVLGTVAVLLSGHTEPGEPPLITGRLLKTRPMTAIGDWSYSIYLWHWPLLIVPMTALGRELNVVEAVACIVATMLAGYLTYEFVEQPFRRPRMPVRRPTPSAAPPTTAVREQRWRALAMYPASLVIVLPLAVVGSTWAESQLQESGDDPAIVAEEFGLDGGDPAQLVQASVLAADAGQAIPGDLTPDLLDLGRDKADVGTCNYSKDITHLCPAGDPDWERTLVLVGDSHARAWIPAFDAIAAAYDYRAFYLVKPQCTAAHVTPARVTSGQPWTDCPEFHDFVTTQLERIRPELVVVTSTAPVTGVYTPEGDLARDPEALADELAQGFTRMYDTYVPLARRVVHLRDVPRLPQDPGACLSTRDATLADCLFPPDETDLRLAADAARVARSEGVQTIDPSTWFCSDGRCPLIVGSTIAYRDRGHISTVRSAELAGALAEELGLNQRRLALRSP